jgi:choline kinase
MPRPPKALILAAGLGSRLKHKTEDRPKALTTVNGAPILVYQLNSLAAHGIDQIGIVLGHQGDKIIPFVREHFPRLHVHYVWNRDYAATNSSYSFWLARDWVQGETYLHLNCDILFSDSLLRRLLESPSENTIAVRKDVPLGDGMENVVLDGERIVRMSLIHTPEASAKAFGLAKLGPSSTCFIAGRLESYLKKGDRNQNYYGMIREAVHEIGYHALDAASDLLMEVNTLEDLDRAESFLREHPLRVASS